jgi:hypothetical protein|tara:strand:- start:488 stop:649 length:162 start_codon:yes stop_codon:yes gene_type:complete
MLSSILQEPAPDATLDEWREFQRQLDDLPNGDTITDIRAEAAAKIRELIARAA